MKIVYSFISAEPLVHQKVTVDAFKAHRAFIASVLAKLDASIEANSITPRDPADEDNNTFEKEVHKEYEAVIDSMKELLGSKYLEAHVGGSSGTVSAEALAKAEKQAAEKAQKQAQEQMQKFTTQLEPTVKKLKTHMEQYERLQTRRADLKEQLEYIGVKLQQTNVLLGWAERAHHESIAQQMLKTINDNHKKQTSAVEKIISEEAAVDNGIVEAVKALTEQLGNIPEVRVVAKIEVVTKTQYVAGAPVPGGSIALAATSSEAAAA